MELREQRYVVTIARYQSIKKAAQELHVTSPTLSTFLTHLEHQLGVKLFDRLGKAFVPTAAGQLYLQAASKMLQVDESYEAQLSDLLQGTTGEITFGIHLRRTAYLVPPVLKKFLGEYPNVKVHTQEMTTSRAYAALENGLLDFIIVNAKAAADCYRYEELYQDYLVAVLAADDPACAHAWKRKDGHDWLNGKWLKEKRLILQLPEQTVRVYTDNFLQSIPMIPKNPIILSNLETAAQLAAEGLGVAFNYEQYIRHFSYSKPIRYFLIGDCTPIPYYIVYRKDKYLPLYTRRFIQLLKEYQPEEEKEEKNGHAIPYLHKGKI